MIQAIETRYKGYRFRSRLEARWAVFFDAMKFRWEYEPEGFVTAAGPYLPDFRVWTPQAQPIWYEIKPEGTEGNDKFEAFERADESMSSRYSLLAGDPFKVCIEGDLNMCPRCGFIHEPAYGIGTTGTENEIYYGCEPCDSETPSGGYHPAEPGVLGIDVSPHKGSLITDGVVFMGLIYIAATTARSYRF